MPTYVKLPAGTAKGLHHARVHAAYGTGAERATIAPCDQQFKPLAIKPAGWVYRSGRAGQGLVKAINTRN